MKRSFFVFFLSLLCLIAYSQTTIINDLKLYKEHKMITYSTAENRKAKGINITIDFPEIFLN